MMNISVRKLPAIAMWFTTFISLFALALFKMPDNYRIHPQLQKPNIMFLRTRDSRLSEVLEVAFAESGHP